MGKNVATIVWWLIEAYSQENNTFEAHLSTTRARSFHNETSRLSRVVSEWTGILRWAPDKVGGLYEGAKLCEVG